MLAMASVGCGAQATSFVKSDTTLGRVVVYRNGVAYFERYADVQGDSLKLAVPQDKVDDFLKSLTVVDAKTGLPAPISYPSAPNQTGGTIEMKVGGNGPRRLRLSYVTEAPSWKPSYRVTVGKNGKVDVQGWAIVDNTSGEDWNSVKLGVGASSAMSFRFDLKGLRMVQRETLHDNDLFAQAPPMGGAAYGRADNARVVADFDERALDFATKKTSANQPRHAEPLAQAAQAINNEEGRIVVEGYANADDKDKAGASLDRANKLRDELIRNGVDGSRVVATGKGIANGHAGGARIVQELQAKTEAHAPAPIKVAPEVAEPIGTSHFESGTTMTVAKGTSAMVSIMREQTDGEVVYLFDPETPRGNSQFPFRTVRFRNPSDNALESGPVTVFGEGSFVGEGLAEPIPAKAIAFVPFALDRQIAVEQKAEERDDISKIISIQRGVLSTEVKHTKKSSFTLFNRSSEKAVVYIRHTLAAGYEMTKSPPQEQKDERLGGARLFRVEVDALGKKEVVLEEATPIQRTTDIRTNDGLALVKAYLASPAIEAPLRDRIEQLVRLNADMAKLQEQIATLHEQMGEYRQRMDELHAQLVTLKAVKTAGPLMTSLEKKLSEVSDALSKATVDVVSLQEKHMVARVSFQNGASELNVESKGARATAAMTK